VYCTGGRVERVRVRVVGEGGVALLAYSDCSSFRDSLLLTEGSGSTALKTVATFGVLSSAARNLTAISSGSASSGVSTEYVGLTSGSMTLELENSIVQGGEQDLRAVGNADGTGTIDVTHSNFDTAKPGAEGKVIDGGGNQTAAPLFVDSDHGDYREASGSPTIDAGAAGQLGALDLDGNPRALGSAPDIGAYEFVPPIPVPEVGRLDSLAVRPGKFRAGNVAGALASRAHKKKKAPLGATVTYGLSAAATVEFHVEHGGTGRRVGKDCVKQSAANKRHKRCVIYKPLTSSFSVTGAAGTNSFKFSGKIDGKALKPGPYRLVGHAGDAIRRAPFTIVK
jgi:hypothetical protein